MGYAGCRQYLTSYYTSYFRRRHEVCVLSTVPIVLIFENAHFRKGVQHYFRLSVPIVLIFAKAFNTTFDSRCLLCSFSQRHSTLLSTLGAYCAHFRKGIQHCFRLSVPIVLIFAKAFNTTFDCRCLLCSFSQRHSTLFRLSLGAYSAHFRKGIPTHPDLHYAFQLTADQNAQ